jgi:pimeloyl-ACP methyl ester carboxylesterase
MAPIADGAGVALSYTERGEGPVALLVHGLASDAAAMAPLGAELAAAGARVIAYDRRG